MNKNKLIEVLEEKNFEVCGLNRLENFINGCFTRKKNGNVKYPIELPKEIMKEGKTGMPLKISDYEIIPLLLFVKEKQPKEECKNE